MEKVNYEVLSKPGKIVNEDIAYGNREVAWVIDSATGLTNKKLTSLGSDGEWFVKEWDKYLKINLNNKNKSIDSILEEGIDKVKELFYKECKKTNVESIQRPSASASILRINDFNIEYFLLSDCTLLIEDFNGNILKIKDNKLEELDNKALKEMKKVRKVNNCSFLEARNAINETLIKHRLLKNKPEGYWTLEFEKEAITHSIKGEFKREKVRKLAIMSDGYSSIFDTYNYCSEKELLNLLSSKGTEYVYNKIREIEENDLEIIEYPRFKNGDDASIVFYEFQV